MTIKQWIKVLGISMLYATFIVMAWTFIIAYGNESKSVLVEIDYYGEGDIEMFVLMPLTLIMGTLALIFTIKDERKIRNDRRG